MKLFRVFVWLIKENIYFEHDAILNKNTLLLLKKYTANYKSAKNGDAILRTLRRGPVFVP
jgi:hypothetical protein